MKKLFFLTQLLIFSFAAFAQTTLGGKIIDAETGEELIGANVTLLQNGHFVTGTRTDFDGNYKLRIEPGTYDVEVTYIGFPLNKRAGLIIREGQYSKLNMYMNMQGDPNPYSGGCSNASSFKNPLLQLRETSSGLIIPSSNIRPMPTKKVRDIIATAPGVTFSW